MALSGKFKFQAQLTNTGSSDLATLSETVDGTTLPSWVITDGTGVDQADILWHDQRTLGAGANEDLDLSGSLTDSFGATVTMVRVKGVVVYAASANGDDVQIGGAASNQFTNWVANSSDVINVRPGGVFAIIAPDATAYPVTAGTGDLLRVTNADGAAGVTYDIYIIGASA